MKKVSVLIVEDDSSIQKNYVRYLERSYPSVMWSFDKAYCKEEAVEFLKNGKYDKIILDGNLGASQHGRDIIPIMTEEQRNKTCVLSCDVGFILEAKNKGILAFDKDDFSHKMDEIFSKII